MKDHTKIEIYSRLKSIAFTFIITSIYKLFIFTPTTLFVESMSRTLF